MQSKGEAVLPIVLQHRKLPWHTVCRLLCCSNYIADVVHQQLSGSIPLKLLSSPVASSEESRSVPVIPVSRRCFFKWLAKHAVLLESLKQGYCSSTVQWHPEDTSLSDSMWQPPDLQQLAAALAQAASLPSGLKLQSLQVSSLALLHSCSSCSTLTSLDLNPSTDMLLPCNTLKALGCFSGLQHQLRHLKLDAGWLRRDKADFGDDSQHAISGPGLGLYCLLRSALPTLTALTRLEVTCKRCADPHILNCTPPQLLELQVAVKAGTECGIHDCHEWPPESLQLGHLDACTSLELLHSDTSEYDFAGVDADATLPPNLQAFCCEIGREPDPNSVIPLLSLAGLTKLSMPHCIFAHASDVQRLSLLTQLQTVHLGYTEPAGYTIKCYDSDCDPEDVVYERTAEEHSAVWGVVPGLDSLELTGQWIDPKSGFLTVLAGLTNLTRLVLRNTWFQPNLFEFGDEWEAWEDDMQRVQLYGCLPALGEALPAGLRVLELCDIIPFVPEPDEYNPWDTSTVGVMMGMRDLMASIASLACLESCEIRADHLYCCRNLDLDSGPGECVKLLLDHMQVWPFAPRCEKVEGILDARLQHRRDRLAVTDVRDTSSDTGGFSGSGVDSPSSPMYSSSVPRLSGLESGGGVPSPVYSSSVSGADGADGCVDSPSSPVYSSSVPGLSDLPSGGAMSSPVYASSVSDAGGADECVDSPSSPVYSTSMAGLTGLHSDGGPLGPGLSLAMLARLGFR